MLTLRLTNKVLKETPVIKTDVLDLPEHGDILEDWHVHLFYYQKSKHLMFTHAASLASFVAAGVHKYEMKDLGKIFHQEFKKFLEAEEIDPRDSLALQVMLSDVRIAKAIDRRVTGSMVDLIKNYPWYISDTYHHKDCTPEEYARYQINRTPLKVLKYANPIGTFRKIIDGLNGFQDIPGHGMVGLN